jgi:carbonic anhydrase
MVSRRSLLTGTAALAAGTLLRSPALSAETQPMATPPAGPIGTPTPLEPANPEAALQRLRDGNARFVGGEPMAPERDLAHLQSLAPKQTPFAAVLACADSRVPVEILFDQGFGNLFVVRVAGNVASAIEIASLEYAVAILGAKALVVLGHTNCGAVDAALQGGQVPGQISTLYSHIAPGLDRKTMNLDAAVVANVRYQARRLKLGSTVLPGALKSGSLVLAGAVFEFHTGEVRNVAL